MSMRASRQDRRRSGKAASDMLIVNEAKMFISVQYYYDGLYVQV
jgi:hypothetical protein